MNRFALPVALLAAHLSLAQTVPLDLKDKTLAATFAELLPALARADRGAQQRWQDLCNQAGAPGNEKVRAEVCTLMAGTLDAATPTATRMWLLTQLQRIGGPESVATLATVLSDQDEVVRDAAARALANNPSPTATTALVTGLKAATGPAKVGLLNALGYRKDGTAVGAIAAELVGDGPTAVAAARALGRIPDAAAAKVLLGAREKATGAVRIAVGNAILAHADRMAAGTERGAAAAIYKSLNAPAEPPAIRLAGLRGSIQTAGDEAGDSILTILGGQDAAARDIAIGLIESLSSGALKTLAGNLDKLPLPSRVSVITAIAARGDRTQLPVARIAAKSPDAEVKRAGILALGRLGDATAVEFLLDAMSGKDATAGIAAESLAALPAEGVNEKLIAVLNTEKTPARVVALIGILERRKAVESVPSLVGLAGGDDIAVRTAAFAALKTMPDAKSVPKLIPALLKAEKGKEREAAEQSLAFIASQVPAVEQKAEPVLAAIHGSSKDRAAELYPLLGRLGGEAAQKLLRAVLDGKDRDAAINGFCNWPDATANGDLLVLAEKGADAEKPRAVQALIRINAVLIDRTPDERLAALETLKKTMPLATRDEDRRALLEGIGFVRHIETLRYVVPFLDRPELAQAACRGVVELAHSKTLREPNKAEFVKPLDRVIATCNDMGLVERARQYKDGR